MRHVFPLTLKLRTSHVSMHVGRLARPVDRQVAGEAGLQLVNMLEMLERV